jgi:hypothetical protein
MDYESTCYRKNEEILKRNKKRNETTPFNQEKVYLTTVPVTLPGDLEVKRLNNALKTSEHEGCFFHNCSYTSLCIHARSFMT